MFKTASQEGTTLSKRQTWADARHGSGKKFRQRILAGTLPETNMAPENNPLEKEIPIGNHYF